MQIVLLADGPAPILRVDCVLPTTTSFVWWGLESLGAVIVCDVFVNYC